MKRTPTVRPVRPPSGPTFASESLMLHSFDYLSSAVVFWSHRLRRAACPTCGVVGSIGTDIRTYGARFICDNCDFEHLEAFEGAVAKRRRPAS